MDVYGQALSAVKASICKVLHISHLSQYMVDTEPSGCDPSKTSMKHVASKGVDSRVPAVMFRGRVSLTPLNLAFRPGLTGFSVQDKQGISSWNRFP